MRLLSLACACIQYTANQSAHATSSRRRNELVALDMVMTILTMGFAFVAMIAGIFGMNLGPLPIQDDNVRPLSCACMVWSQATLKLIHPRAHGVRRTDSFGTLCYHAFKYPCAGQLTRVAPAPDTLLRRVRGVWHDRLHALRWRAGVCAEEAAAHLHPAGSVACCRCRHAYLPGSLLVVVCVTCQTIVV